MPIFTTSFLLSIFTRKASARSLKRKPRKGLKMPTHTVERQELLQAIETLPDDSVIVTLDFVRSLRNEQPNAETAAAIEECRARRGKRASNIEEFFEAMHNAVDTDA
jgi:hypothetical protein